MYKVLIIFIALLFALVGGYYISTAGGGIMKDIIVGDVSSQESLVPISEDDLAGVFTCLNSSTCKHPYTLILNTDKTVQLLQGSPSDISQDEDNQNNITVEHGLWNIGVKNMLVITLNGNNNEEYSVAQKIVINNVTSKILSKISYTKTHYPDMHNPIFVKNAAQ